MNGGKRSIAALAGALALAAATPAVAGYLEEHTSEAARVVTDWSEGVLEVTGRGTARFTGNRVQEELLAVEAARAMAQKKLVEALDGVRVRARTTVRQMAMVDQEVETRVRGMLQGALPVREKVVWTRDGAAGRGEVPWAEVTLRLCLSKASPACAGSLTTVYETVELERAAPPAAELFAEPDAAAEKVAAWDRPFTGLVVDLAGQSYLPVLAPEVVAPDGKVVFAGAAVKPRILVERGAVRYAATVEEALKTALVGDNPLVVKVEAVKDDNRIVISRADAARLFRANFQGEDFLGQGKVVIALD